MPTNDSADPTAQEADQRAARAKASLLSRLELLKQKLTDAKDKVDLRTQITMHPLPAVGIAFALGMLAGLQRTRGSTPQGMASHPFTSTVFAGLTAVGLRLLREVALAQLGVVAKDWWTERDGTSQSEVPASHLTDVEPFLEH